MTPAHQFDYDVAIIGGGPAGLSAALTLGRSCRAVAVFDHAKPRNFAAKAVHCFLGLDGLAPQAVRRQGRDEALRYGATFFDEEVTETACLTKPGDALTGFALKTDARQLRARCLLFATGMIDQLPDIPGFAEAYGTLVHHCPFCDGWEHRDEALIAFGNANSAAELGAELLGWSNRVTVCTNGEPMADQDRAKLERLGVAVAEGPIARLDAESRMLEFRDGRMVPCEGLFFSAAQAQRSDLPRFMGCECDAEGLVVTKEKQCTSVPGVYLAGDADGDVQFSVVAAAEGAIAAASIHQALLKQDQEHHDAPAREPAGR